MRFNPNTCPRCGSPFEGQLDVIPGVALMTQFEDGSYEWTGTTDVHWDGQMPERPDGNERKVILVCSNDACPDGIGAEIEAEPVPDDDDGPEPNDRRT